MERKIHRFQKRVMEMEREYFSLSTFFPPKVVLSHFPLGPAVRSAAAALKDLFVCEKTVLDTLVMFCYL